MEDVILRKRVSSPSVKRPKWILSLPFELTISRYDDKINKKKIIIMKEKIRRKR